MRRFCEEENLDYSRFCRYARNHPVSQEAATSDIIPDTFVELKVMGEEATAAPKPSSAISIREILLLQPIRPPKSTKIDYAEIEIPVRQHSGGDGGEVDGYGRTFPFGKVFSRYK